MSENYEYNDVISKNQYEKRFWQRSDGGEDLNVVGYGKGSPFVPPIGTPITLLDFWDRWCLTLVNDPFTVVSNYYLNYVLNGLALADHEDGYTYNHAEAAGVQLYPYGIHKYYDLFSEEGVWNFVGINLYYRLQWYLSYFTILPWDIWIAIFTLPTDGIMNFFLYPIQYTL